MGDKSNPDGRVDARVQNAFGRIHAEGGSFKGITIDAPLDRVGVWVRNLNVILTRKKNGYYYKRLYKQSY